MSPVLLSDRLSATLADLEELSEEHDQLARRHEQVLTPKIGIAGIAPLYVCAACGTERTGLAHGIHPVWQMMYTAHVIIICNINVLKCSA